MKTIVLKSLKLRNYMGAQKKDFNFGQITKILGTNGSGKTTIQSAFNWLLFGKNEKGETTFNLKPLDGSGESIHKLDVEVEGIFSVDGKDLKLKRVFAEKWVTKRGCSEQEFEGHTTAYWVDDVPQPTKKAYETVVSSLIEEKVFKLITDPTYFSQQLSWQQQRDFLQEITEETTDDEIISNNVELAGLLDILDGKSAEDFKTMIKAQIKECKNDKKSIPVRINEADTNRPQLPVETLEQLQQQKKVTTENRDGVKKAISDVNIRNQNIDNQFNQLSSLKAELSIIETNIKTEEGKGRNDLISKKFEINNKITELQNQIKQTEQAVSDKQTLIINKQNEIGRIENIDLPNLRNEYTDLAAKTFIEPDRTSGDFTCSCCGQSLPTDNIDAKINEMRGNFNSDKESKLTEINNRGKQLKESIPALQSEISKFDNDIELFTQQVKDFKEQLTKQEAEYKTIEDLLSKPVATIDFTKYDGWVDKSNMIKEFEANMSKAEDSSALLEQLNTYNQELELINSKIKIYDDNTKVDNRIEELKQQEKTLVDKILDLESKEMKVELFTNKRIEALEQKVNNKFGLVKFKLFRDQINGGIKEVCDAYVPCGKSLVVYNSANQASKIHAGMDIIKTISEHYGISAPIFVDNNEAIVDPFTTGSQVIGLYVDESAKELTVEV